MPRLERDQIRPADSPPDPLRDAPAHAEPISDADESAAHIAALVRRTSERQGRSAPAPSADPVATSVHPSPAPASQVPASQVPASEVPVPTVTAPVIASRVTAPVTAPQVAQPSGPEITGPDEGRPHPTTWHPSRRILVAAGAIVVLLIGGGVALSHPFGPDEISPPASTLGTTAPSGYAVKVTDVTSDCASHSRGKAKASFEAENCVTATRVLASGEVGGRPVLFVVSRIEMATAEAAASVKQVLDGDGTGNLNDLLRDGKTYPGAPQRMPISGYASVQVGKVVAVAEAGFVDEGRSSSTDPALRSAAAEVAAMLTTRS